MQYIVMLEAIWISVVGISRFLGKVVIVLLFIGSASVLTNLIASAFGFPNFFIGAFEIAKAVYGDKVAWASTSIVLATSVALGHIKNLEINETKLSNEIEDRLKAESEERRKRNE
jgi:hypothetical protein